MKTCLPFHTFSTTINLENVEIGTDFRIAQNFFFSNTPFRMVLLYIYTDLKYNAQTHLTSIVELWTWTVLLSNL